MTMPDSKENESLPLGTRLKLEAAGEGWFKGAGPVLFGSVVSALGRKHDSNPWYLVELDEPLEIQESGHDTPSGLRLVRYSQLLVSCRWQATEINEREPVSVFVNLVPQDRDAGEHLDAIEQPTVWANCVIGGGAA